MTASWFCFSGRLRAGLLVLPLLWLSGGSALAQKDKLPANALPGFSQSRDMPVKIHATRLEVRDKRKEATFVGDVVVTQGDTEMRCRTLVVYYEGNDDKKGSDTKTTGSVKPASAAPASANGGGQQQIRRIEARGDVRLVQKDQNATGDSGIFDLRTNTVTLSGNVVVTRGQDVLRGQRIVIDLTTGVSRVEGGGTQQGVDMLILPNGNGNALAAPAPPPPPPPRRSR